MMVGLSRIVSVLGFAVVFILGDVVVGAWRDTFPRNPPRRCLRRSLQPRYAIRAIPVTKR